MSLSPEQHTIPARYPVDHGTRYLLPVTLLRDGGLWEYVLIDPYQARLWLESGPLVSHLSHPLLRLALERVVGMETPLPVRGPLPRLGYHDDALIWSVEQYETLPQQLTGCSTLLRQLLEEDRYSLGLLRRLA